MTKIIVAALALSLMPISYALAQTAPTTQEECEKVEGMKWEAGKCVPK